MHKEWAGARWPKGKDVSSPSVLYRLKQNRTKTEQDASKHSKTVTEPLSLKKKKKGPSIKGTV